MSEGRVRAPRQASVVSGWHWEGYESASSRSLRSGQYKALGLGDYPLDLTVVLCYPFTLVTEKVKAEYCPETTPPHPPKPHPFPAYIAGPKGVN